MSSRATLLGLSLISAILGLSGHAAFAHAHLVSATPAAKSEARPAPTELRLEFSEGIEIKFSRVTVKGPDHALVKTGPARPDPKDNKVLIVPVPSPLADGTYTVDWQALSTDGHKTKGSYSFDSMQ